MPRPRPRDPGGELAGGGTKSPMARATEDRPFKPYVWRGERDKPPAVTAARQRHRDVDAVIAQRMWALDDPDSCWWPDPGYPAAWFWLRELTEDTKYADDDGGAA